MRRGLARPRKLLPGRTEDPILKFDKTGKLIAKWGSERFAFPHGATVDAEGNLWVTDGGGGKNIGHQIFKFSPEVKVLLTLGKAGVAGSGHDTFTQPCDVAMAPNVDTQRDRRSRTSLGQRPYRTGPGSGRFRQ